MAVFRWLAEWLGEDLPFSEVPSERRIQAAIFAAKATLTDVEIDPETFTVLDAGRPSFTAEGKFAGRQLVRLASLEEATIKRIVGAYRAAPKEMLPIHYRHVLNATIEESFHKPHKGQRVIGKTEIQRRGNDDLKARAVKDGGAEVLVLHVNWNETNNADLGRAFASLCERIRPEKWPELVGVPGDREQSADKALRVLIWWRMTAAIDAHVSFVGLGGDPKAALKQRAAFKVELEKKRRGMAANVKRAKGEAEGWFANITGDKEKPWWVVESVTNRK